MYFLWPARFFATVKGNIGEREWRTEKGEISEGGRQRKKKKRCIKHSLANDFHHLEDVNYAIYWLLISVVSIF